ncbi:TonB-dependent receptor [Rubrimonas cliftonensis]|uniref:Iron complex outermembrane recepter protein n=1 Tax=Rubrimonas cliftonensis TaxID=89524 RepID=A0A1H4F2G7_9RHOB|nr:TonB-dependent siderophore receptor [Rubrimonas cliftonensis]SEA90672.1 iron complex outermembrane recepter protein [Rubrimonas cliftonensis]
MAQHECMARLLASSGFVICLAAGVAAQPIVLDQIVVEGSQVELAEPFAGGQVATGGRAGLLGNLDYRDAPFSGTAYTAEFIEDQQAASVGDVLLNDPTVRVANGFGNFQEVYVIRGFPVFSDDITLNGLYGILPRQTVAAPLVERVEVLRGANAFLNGAAPGNSGVGGTVNLVPKRAPSGGINSLTTGFESDGQFIGTIDVGRRFGGNEAWGVRVGATGRVGDTAVDDEERSLAAASLGVDYDGEDFRFSADLGYQDNSLERPRPQVTPTGAVPETPDADANYAQPWTSSDERQLFFAARGEFDLNDSITTWLAGGFRLGEEENVLSNPRATAEGVLTSSRFDNAREDTVLSGDAGVRADFETGPISHRAVLSGSVTRLEFKNAFALADFAGFPAGTLHDPVAFPPPPTDAFIGGDLSNPLTTEKTTTASIAFADTLSFFDDKVLLTLGGRYQTIKTEAFDANTGAETSEIDGSAFTPAIGLVVKPFENVSLFANYVEALQQGRVAPSSSGGAPIMNAGEVLDPFVSEQFEIGAKYVGDRFGATLSLFSITQQQALVENGIFSADGEQRNRGVELTLFGEPFAGLRVLGGATFVEAELRRTTGGANDGKDAVGVPNFQGNLGVEWDVPIVEGLTLGGRAIYTGEQFVNAANTFEADSWVRVDLGASYATVIADRAVTFRARVENVADEAYWASVGGFPGANYLVQGAPRTLIVSANVRF